VARKRRARLRTLVDVVTEAHPGADAGQMITAGRVLVDGRPVTNPASLVRESASVTIRQAGDQPLRGEAKLRAALDAFGIAVRGRVALDLGAAAGGFTRALLKKGAARVYAVDTGYGQLLGSLRQDPAVVNLERTNLAELGRTVVPDTVDLVVADLSYVSLADAVPQLNDRASIADDADLVAVVKPQFELALPIQPTRTAELDIAVDLASSGIERAGWTVLGTQRSPIHGARGSIEFLLHARRRSA
jgi:23S rRNA (cytidine1920-2'-O)/16S rRNA (cytidine1409-2'-O)-methyltransferase